MVLAPAFGQPEDIRTPTLVDRRVDGLRPHPRYQDLCGPIVKLDLFELERQGQALFEEPLMVTDTGIILDGYKRWTLARTQGRLHLSCLEYAFNTD